MWCASSAAIPPAHNGQEAPMLTPTFNITAYDNVQNKRTHLFTWCRGAEQGIQRAKSEAAELGLDKYLSDYQAEPIAKGEPR
jgi:hypothetical protein